MGLHKYAVIGCTKKTAEMQKLLSNQNSVTKHIKDMIDEEKNNVEDSYIRVDNSSDETWGTIGWESWLKGEREPRKWYRTIERFERFLIESGRKKEEENDNDDKDEKQQK